MTKVSASQNRNRGAQDERDIDRLLKGNGRWEANSGGPEDVKHDQFSIQVKGGKSVTSATMRDALEDARKGAARAGKIPLVALVDRSGTRIQRWVCFPMEEFVESMLPSFSAAVGVGWYVAEPDPDEDKREWGLTSE